MSYRHSVCVRIKTTGSENSIFWFMLLCVCACVRAREKLLCFTAAQTKSYGHITPSLHIAFRMPEIWDHSQLKTVTNFLASLLWRIIWLWSATVRASVDKYGGKKTLLCLIVADAAILESNTHCHSTESENFADFSELWKQRSADYCVWLMWSFL